MAERNLGERCQKHPDCFVNPRCPKCHAEQRQRALVRLEAAILAERRDTPSVRAVIYALIEDGWLELGAKAMREAMIDKLLDESVRRVVTHDPSYTAQVSAEFSERPQQMFAGMEIRTDPTLAPDEFRIGGHVFKFPKEGG